MPYPQALQLAENFIANSPLQKPLIVGSIGRGELLVGDIDILAEDKNRVGERADTEYNGIQVNVWYTDVVNREAMRLYLYGPCEANMARSERAKKVGFKYNIYGLWKDEVKVANDESSILKMIMAAEGDKKEVVVEDCLKTVQFSNPSGDYLQVGTIRLEEDGDNFKVVSIFELFAGKETIRRYVKIKCEGVDRQTADHHFNKWIGEKEAKNHTRVG